MLIRKYQSVPTDLINHGADQLGNDAEIWQDESIGGDITYFAKQHVGSDGRESGDYINRICTESQIHRVHPSREDYR